MKHGSFVVLSRDLALSLAVVCLSGLSARGDVFTYSEADRTLTATVPSGETVQFLPGDANAQYLTGNLATNFIKTGEGVLSADLDLSAYLGDLTVEQGVYSYVTNTALGKLAGANACGVVRVKSGATLDCHNKIKNPWTWWNKCILFEGTGAGDWGGALTFSGDAEINRMVFSSNLVMTANATIRNRVSRTMYMSGGSYPVWIDMAGHDLTFTGNAIAWGCLNLKNPGNMTNDGIQAFTLQNGNTYLNGDASNTLTLDGGKLLFNKTSGSLDWTLDATAGKGINITDGYDPVAYNNATNISYWSGPVHLGSTTLPIALSKWHFSIFGPIDGDGGLSASGYSLTNGVLHLFNPENAFTGGVCANMAEVRLWNDGALPADGGPLALTNASVRLANDEAVYDLPALVLGKTGTVYRGQGNWRGSVTKDGAGDFIWNSLTTSGVFDVRQGRIVVKDVSRYAMAGMIESKRIYAKNYSDVQTHWTAYEVNTNGVVMSPAAYYDDSHHLWKDPLEYYDEKGTKIYDRYMLSYTGYLWNNEPTNVTWSFAGAAGTHLGVTLDGQLMFKFVGTSESSTTVMGSAREVTPGPHWLDIRGYTAAQGASIQAGNFVGNKDMTRGIIWPTKNFAVGFDRLGRGSTNQVDYVKLIDPGDGSLLTWGLPAEGQTEVQIPGTDRTVRLFTEFATMKFARGAGLKVERKDFELKDLEGVPFVEGATNSFAIASSWTVDAADLAAGQKLSVSGKLKFKPGMTLVPSRGNRTAKSGVMYVLAEAEGGIEGLPELPEDAVANWTLVKSPDGKTLRLGYSTGLMLIVR